MIRIPKIQAVTLRHEGERVLLIAEGRAVLDMPWEAADELARALTVQARRAEELSKAMPIARDAAVLLRAGVPMGLSSHPKIKAEAVKIARDDRNLRRYMPGGIRSTEQFGAPAVHVHQPRKEP